MHEELAVLAVAVKVFLQKALPRLGDDWWSSRVIDKLSDHTRSRAQLESWTELDRLDTAALLQVLKHNWRELRESGAVRFEDYTLVQECLDIRHRLAHAPVGVRTDDRVAYRDIDTICLLATRLRAPEEIMALLEDARERALSRITDADRPATSSPAPPGTSAPAEPASPTDGAFAIGDMVRVVATPDVVGMVHSSRGVGPAATYQVFHSGAFHRYLADQLAPVGAPEPARLSADELRAQLTAARINNLSQGVLYSFNSGRIEYEPYQFRPVLKLIRSDRPRLLIADDVGVGKTIEAGLILKELSARQTVESVLVICPKPLVTEHKWRTELKRFDEDFVELDGPALRNCIREAQDDGEWPRNFRKAILPYSLLDSGFLEGKDRRHGRIPGIDELDFLHWDLVIIDEAHHVRNSSTQAYKAIKSILDAADAAVFLTATPIQTSDDDLYTLLNLLRPDVIIGKPEFRQMLEPNGFLTQASIAARGGLPGWRGDVDAHLESALATAWGAKVMTHDPDIQYVRSLLSASTDDDADVRVKVIRQVEELNTFAGIINRTRRRDIGNFTTRRPETVSVEFSEAQQEVYTTLMELCRQLVVQSHGGMPEEFLLGMLQRQASSSINGLAPFIRSIIENRAAALDPYEPDSDVLEESEATISSLSSDLADITEKIVAKAERLEDDPKFDAFRTIVEDKKGLDNNKMLVFSTFRHTIAYLDKRLRALGVRVGIVTGVVPDEERRQLRKRFALDKDDAKALDVLVSSEVGTEGLDYQFCDSIVNYDLPWNPMRIEQRIGRIDRRGQKSESISIKNLITKGTVDASIYERCLVRIGVFENALGASEEILGDLTVQMRRIGEDLTLTEEQRDERLIQLADNQLSRSHEESRLEEEQDNLFGLSVQATSDSVDAAVSPWLMSDGLLNLVETYLRDLDPDPRLVVRSQGALNVRPSRQTRKDLLAELGRTSEPDALARRWQSFLKSGESSVRLSPDPEVATEDPTCQILGISHPLVRQAAAHVGRPHASQVSLLSSDEDLPRGRHEFAIFGWTVHGVTKDYALQCVSSCGEVVSRWEEVLAAAQDSSVSSDPDVDELDHMHYSIHQAARSVHVNRSREQIDKRMSSLSMSLDARRGMLEDLLARVTEPKIQRMRSQEINNIERDTETRLEELEHSKSLCDIHAEPLVYGTLEVVDS